jgi:hypothetical protein
LVDRKAILAPGFSARGDFTFGDGGLAVGAGATVNYVFNVPEGRTLTVAYGIPAGCYVNTAPAEISVNDVTIT